MNNPKVYGRLSSMAAVAVISSLVSFSTANTLAQTPVATPTVSSSPSLKFRPSQGMQNPVPASHLLGQLSAALAAERHDEVHALVEELHTRWPNQDEYTALWLDQRLQSNDPSEHNETTLNALWRLRSTHPKSATMAFALGKHYARLGRWSDAQSAFQSAHALAPDHPDPAYNLGVSWEQLGQTALALHYYRIAINKLNTQPTLSAQSIAQIRARLAMVENSSASTAR